MSKVVVRTQYFLSGKSVGEKFTNYIAKREGVDKTINTKRSEVFVQYAAERPGVVKLGEHGLFGQEDYVDLKKASKEIYNHKGIVWTEVVSLRQEDAERLGYDTPEAWRNLVRSKQFEIAYYHKISADNLKWYGAFHKAEGHYHMHLIVFNKNPGGEFISKKNYNQYKDRKTKGNPDRVEYVCNGYHRYSEVNCTSHRIREEMLDQIVQAELTGIRLVFDDLWENVEADVKKWAAGKSTTEKRLENLRNSIAETEIEIQKILMERIEDKQNSDMYDKMIETRRDDIEKFKKEISEIENLDKTIKERKATLKHSIELLDDIIAENNISNANLHLMFDKIVIEETDEGLNLDLRLKSPFISKKKEPLLKKYMIVDNEVLSVGA